MSPSRKVSTLLVALGLAIGLALPASAAPGTKHGSCAVFGTTSWAGWATSNPPGTVGAVISSLAPTSELLGENTKISDVLHAEMTREFLGGPYCEIRG
jgi:hypothetical protein